MGFDFLIPDRVLAADDFDEVRRARLLVFAVVLASSATLLVSVMLHFIGYAEAGTAVVWTSPWYLAVYGLFVVTKSPRLAAHAFVLLFFFTITLDYGEDGGFGVLATAVLPLAATALLGTKGGIFWTLVALAWTSWLGPYWVRAGDFSPSLSLVAALICLINGVAAVLVETTRAQAARQARDASNRLKFGQGVMQQFLETTFPAHAVLEDGVITHASDGAAELVGTPVDQLKGRSLLDQVHPQDRSAVFAEFSRSDQAGFRTEVRLRHADGRWLWVEGFGVPLSEGDSRSSVWIYAARSVENERRARDRLEQAKRLEGVGLLAAGIAHDFNNLLTVIRGFSELLPETEERAHVITAADKAAELTASLMAFGRSAPKSEASVDVGAAVQKWSPMFRSLLGEQRQLQVSVEPRVVHASIDETQLNQVLLNLVTNAKEAMPVGGTLSINVDYPKLSKKERTRLGLQHRTSVRFRVRDDGVGMSRQVQEHAFDPFYTTKDMAIASGLGLASVYGIVQQQGGAIDLESVPGQGTEVTVWLPQATLAKETEPAAKPEIRSSQDGVRGGGREVLLVEDDRLVSKWLYDALDGAGYAVRSSSHPEAALQMLTERPPDLLLTDIVMPGMRGTELAARARELQPDLAVLFMSGYDDGEIGDWRAVSQRRTRFLAKPFGSEALMHEIDALLDEPYELLTGS